MRDALTDLAQMVVKWLWPLLCLGLLLGGPGLALGLWLARRHAFSYVLPLGLASWALLLLWSTTLHIPFASATIWAATVSSWAAALWFLHRQRVLGPSLCARLRSRETWLLMLVSACTLAMRLLNVRELVVPNWVDSLHHSAITQLIIDNAALPVDGGRFVSLPGMYYHFGFHAVAAALAQAAGIASYTAVLIVGQALLALAPLAVYSLTQAWTHRRRAGLIGALIVGCWSYMPAYYTSWGRYTQMAGLLVLSGAMLAVWQLTSPSLQPWRDRALAAALVAGLVLTHYRASAMLLPWAALALVGVAVKGRARLLLGASSAMLLSIIFAGPWLWRLLSRFTPEFAAQYGSLAAAPGANDAWPSALLSYRWTPGLLGGAALGALWALARKRWRIAMIGLWAGLCVLLPNLYWLGLPDVWLVDNVSVVISYWLPVGLLCGWLIADQSGLLVCWLRRHGRCASLRSAKVAGAVLYTGLVLWGSWLHVDVVNPSTVLVARQDMSAAAWISEHLPQDALILVNSVHWSNGARRGSDGGWWLPLLANRQVTLPNLLYIQGSRKDYAEINRFAVAVEQATDFCDPSFIQMLRERGVTHVYVGAKGGSLTPERLSGCPAFTLQYSQGPTRIYALASGGGSLRRARACSIWASVSATSSMATRCLR